MESPFDDDDIIAKLECEDDEGRFIVPVLSTIDGMHVLIYYPRTGRLATATFDIGLAPVEHYIEAHRRMLAHNPYERPCYAKN